MKISAAVSFSLRFSLPADFAWILLRDGDLDFTEFLSCYLGNSGCARYLEGRGCVVASAGVADVAFINSACSVSNVDAKRTVSIGYIFRRDIVIDGKV